MALGFEWFVARRYVFSRKRERLTGVIANISVAGITIGVAALIVVIAVMTGFQEILRERILSVSPHIIVEKVGGPFVEYSKVAQKIKTQAEKEKWPLENLYPFISLQGLLLAPAGESGVILKGLPFEEVRRLHTLKLIAGEIELSEESPYPLLLGRRLANRLGVSVGDRLRFLYPQGHMTPFGLLPRFIPFRVAGIFETGLYDYDLSLALVPLAVARKIYGENRGVTGLEIKLQDPFVSGKITKQLRKSLGYTYYVVDWQTLNRSLFSALKLEKAGMFVVLTLIVVVAAFNIVAALVMLVSEKRPDIALLKALGATEVRIRRIFLLSGFLLGILGTLGGLALGLFLCAILSRYPVIRLPSDVYPVDYLPVKVEALDVITIVFCALILTLLAAVFPARQAAKLPPAEVLRYG